MRKTAVAITVLLASCASAPPMDRIGMMAEIKRLCVAEVKQDPRSINFESKVIDDYCECAAIQAGNKVTPQELTSLHQQPDKPQFQALLASTVATCRPLG